MAALVELRDVVKHFPVTRTLGEIVRGAHPAVHALDGVTFDVGDGETAEPGHHHAPETSKPASGKKPAKEKSDKPVEKPRR